MTTQNTNITTTETTALETYQPPANIFEQENLGSYFSMPIETKKDKIKAFNALSNPTHRLDDAVNEVLEIEHVMLHIVELVDQNTGEMTTAPRTVLVTKKGESYVAVSKGVFGAMKNIVGLFGTPDEWEEPLKMKVKKVTKAQNKITTIELV